MKEIAEHIIEVEQMLHGYAGGHRLLEASVDLSKAGQRISRRMSDLSGSSVNVEFDGYLTGYPLEEDGWYALAKTWFAKELKRPGCVWTHTLLIHLDDLEKVHQPNELMKVFRRPNGESDKSYQKATKVSVSHVKEVVKETVGYVAEVLYALYGSDDDVVVLPSRSAADHETLILGIWAQQWPALRQKFSFCSGALDIRLDENRLDIQATPRQRRLLSINRKDVVVVWSEKNETHSNSQWAKLAAESLTGNGRNNLYRFLKHYGEEQTARRTAVSHYINCFAELNDNLKVSEGIRVVAKEFPNNNEAVLLKESVVGWKREFFRNATESEVLHALLCSSVATAYDLDALKIGERFCELWKKEEDEAWNLLRQLRDSNQTEIVDCLIYGISDLVNKDNVGRVAAESCDLAIEVVRRNPSLAVVSDVWRCKEIKFDSLGEEFRDRVFTDEDFAKSIIAAWVLAERKDCMKELANAVGPSIARLLLSSESYVLSLMDRQAGIWHSVIMGDPEECLAWLRSQKTASAEAAGMAMLGVSERNQFDLRAMKAWAKASTKGANLSRFTLCNSHVKMLAIALEHSEERIAEKLVNNCFPLVYEAAMQSEISDHLWEMLERRLPQAGLWWDRCKKLRMGLLEYCVRNNWMSKTFVKCTAIGFAYEQVLGSWGLDLSERSYLQQTIQDILNGKIRANMDQKAAAERYSRWF